MAQAKRTPITYDDLLLLPEDGRRHELIGGRHHVSAAPSTRHQRVALALAWEIESFLRANPLGELFVAPLDVVLSPTDVVEPDLLYVSRGRADVVAEANLHGIPDLVVEILSRSSSTRDRHLKRQLYESYGAFEYWIVDPDSETVEVRELRSGRFGAPRVLTKTDPVPLTTDLLPGLELPLDRIFRA